MQPPYGRARKTGSELAALLLNDCFEVVRVGITRNVVFGAGGAAFSAFTVFRRLQRWL